LLTCERTRLEPGAEQNITFARLARLCHDPRFLPGSLFMDAFLVSTGIVALAEIGDKTQLLEKWKNGKNGVRVDLIGN
jgi:hypothetical protein